ncbi:kip1 ubiquitination-promoting complex subunit 2 [Lasioglossum baleicum]|uniref:kip1 ubiquitination-promoting complex subunit 2 n=1 Tax=Lasioglossum baleicum TaxID=434251 RepID=UPI003FCD0F16
MAPTKNFLINVISPEGHVANVTVQPNLTIEKIKTLAMKQLYGNDKTKEPSQFRLVHLSKFKQLSNGNNISDEEIRQNDSLLLVKIRPVTAKLPLTGRTIKGPNEEAIFLATHDLPLVNPPRHIPPPPGFMDVDMQSIWHQNEIRNILISLVRTSAKILTYSPEAEKTYNILKEKLKSTCNPTVDQNYVKILTEMGYTHKKSLKALRLTKSNIIEAIKWLIRTQNDVENDDDNDCFFNIENIPDDGNLITIVDLLLENLYRFKCELLGDKSPSLKDMNEGFNPDSPVYQAIIDNPHIQLSLKNPKMLLAYLSIIENASSIWMLDIDVSLILKKIFMIYRHEKHALHINQFTDDNQS